MMAEVRLRPIRMSDAEICFRWVTDPEVVLHLGLTRPPRSVREERAWIATVLSDPEHLRMFVVEDDNGLPIGTTTLRGIEPGEGIAHFGILIGEKRLWDRGYGTAATRKTLAFAFRELGLREVRLSCYSRNGRALRCYQKAGFVVVGREAPWRPEGGADLKMRVTREAWMAQVEGE